MTVEASDAAGAVPDGWAAVPLGDLFTFKNGLNKAKGFFGYGSKIVNYMDVFTKSALTGAQLSGRVSVDKGEIKSYDVRKGDVFFTRTSETAEDIGVASVMLDEPEEAVFSGFVLRARPKDDRLEDGFKRFCFASEAVRSQIVSTCSYTTRALTNGRALSAVVMPVPPREEQLRIGAALREADARSEALDGLIVVGQAVEGHPEGGISGYLASPGSMLTNDRSWVVSRRSAFRKQTRRSRRSLAQR